MNKYPSYYAIYQNGQYLANSCSTNWDELDPYGPNAIIEDINLDECRKLYHPATELTFLEGEVVITIATYEPVTMNQLNEYFPYDQVDHELTGPLSEVW